MNHILVVCDKDEAYASKLVSYMNLKGGFPFVARYFSSVENLEAFCIGQKVEVALVSEEYYKQVEQQIQPDMLILLGEKPGMEQKQVVWKYQSVNELMKQVLDILSRQGEIHSHISRKKPLKVIGFYSPVKRTLQTSFAITFGQLLAKKSRTLYMNLEAYSGLDTFVNCGFSKDLSDLLYYLQNGKKGLAYYLYSIAEKIGELELLPPMRCQLDLISITQKEWQQLMNEIELGTEYEYLLLDLSDSIQGLYEILRNCDRIYTFTAEDGFAMAKIDQYEKILRQCQYEDVLEKTKKCNLPKFNYLPKQLERMTVSELATEAKNFLREDFYAK